MAPATPRLRILSVGGNDVSAFLSWRLQATNACDVTLVWKTNYEHVKKYGIQIKSVELGTERFKPYLVVQTPEEAMHSSKLPFDYVLLCVKALPDVYSLADIIKDVVTPQHTCILLNTTRSIGIEEHLEERFSTNIILSLVCGADLTLKALAEFEHKGVANMWVGWANKNPAIPEEIQQDMAEALAMTLSTAQVECLVSLNIRQQQMERMIGPIAFHPLSVLFNNPNLAHLYDDTVGVASLISGIIDELILLGTEGLGCLFPTDFRDSVIKKMKLPAVQTGHNGMYMDYTAKRHMEIEVFLNSPLRLAKKMSEIKKTNIILPRLEAIYALMHDKNEKLRLEPEVLHQPDSYANNNRNLPPPRTSSMAGPLPPGARPMMNGKQRLPMNGSRAPSLTGPPPAMRRNPYMNGGYRNGAMANGAPPQAAQYGLGRRDSTEGENLEEFTHVIMYGEGDGNVQDGSSGSFGEQSGGGTGTPSSTELQLREKELALRQRELDLQEQRVQQMNMRRPPPSQSGRRPPRQAPVGALYDDDDEDDFFDPMSGGHPGVVDDNIDMMSITSRRNRKTSSSNGNYKQGPPSRGLNMFRKNRTSARILNDMPSPHDSIMNNPLLGYSSNRYGSVDRQALEAESRQNSMAGSKMEDIARAANNNGTYPNARRMSHSPGNILNGPIANRPSPPNGYSNGGMRPGPPMANGGGMVVDGGAAMAAGFGSGPMPMPMQRQSSMPRPPVIEQQVGVSNSLYPPKPFAHNQVRNLTGSTSASAQSGDSASANTGSANSAASSSSSLQPRNAQQLNAQQIHQQK